VKKKIIALSGKAGAGKDTLAAMLVGDWERVSFADPLKEMCSDLVDLHIDFFHNRDLKDTPMVIGGKLQSPRDLLVSVGSYYRTIDPNYWVKKVVEKINKSNKECFVVTDCRYPDELEALKDISETRTVRIVGRGDHGSSCATECALDSYNFDYVIPNRTSEKDLEARARILSAIMGNQEALGDLYTELRPRVSNLCRKHVFSQVDIEDFASEALCKILELLPSRFNFTCQLSTFAYSITYFTAQNRRRKWSTYNKYISFSEAGVDGYSSTKPLDSETLDLGGVIEEAVSRLSPLDKKIFTLRSQGCKHKEIGKELEITAGYSRRRLHSIYKKLREDLGDYYSEIIK